jgi:hypothetical protein
MELRKQWRAERSCDIECLFESFLAEGTIRPCRVLCSDREFPHMATIEIHSCIRQTLLKCDF